MQSATKRRSFIAGSLGMLAASGARPARAAEFNFKLANDLPPSDPMNVRLTAAIKEIDRESGGRLSIRLFPSSQLGAISEELNQVRSGALELYCCGYGNQIPVAPLAGINSLAFAWTDYDRIWAAMDGELGAFLAAEVAKSGTIQHVSKPFDVGFRQTTSGRKPINSPDDLKGFKIRVPPAPILASLFTALNASPVNLSLGEVYPALQTGLVEGSDNPFWVLAAMRIYEVQKYITMTNHSWDGYVMVANSRAWARLPPDLQKIASARFREAAVAQRVDVLKLESDAQAKLEANGVSIIRPQPGLFREALHRTDYYTTWRQKIGPEGWDVLRRSGGLGWLT